MAVVDATAWNTARMLELDPASREILGQVVASPALATLSVAGFAVVAVLAVLGCATRAARRVPLWLWAAPVLLWLSTAPFAVNFARFRWPLDPFLVLLAACALAAAARRTAVARARPRDAWDRWRVLFGDVLVADDPDAHALGERLRDPRGVLAVAGTRHDLDVLVAAQRPDLLVIAAPPHHALHSRTQSALHHPPCHVAVAPRGYAERAAAVRAIGIGYLDTPEGRAALDAARGLAFRWQAQIEAIGAVPHSHWPASDAGAGWRAIAAAERLSEIPGIHGSAVEGDVRQALSALARRVDLLVVGPRRHGPLVHLVRGDVLAHLARTSPCPLVLIDPRTPTF